MTFTVLTFQITTDYTGYANWITPRKILVILDDSTYTLSVEIRDGSNNLIESPTSGPPLFSGANGMATQITQQPFYQWCDGTTLKKIGVLNTFPYASIGSFPNNVACQVGPTCDLEISNSFTVTPASSESTTDGSIQVSATSSNGTIRYSTDPNFDYTTGGNTTGLFTGLLPGTYTIYAKDSVGCQDSISVTIHVTETYGVKYRGQYDCINGFETRVDILERAYAGSVTEIKMGGTPFILNYEESDKYTPFIASHCVIQLMQETEDQFFELITQDDRKYRIDFYKDLGSGFVLKWTGYILPSFLKSPFVRSTNNTIEFTASDQLGNLKQEEFVDSSGNIFRGYMDQLTLICEILKKTGLNLNIRSADNIFETNMDITDSDDPLNQAFLDTRVFIKDDEPVKCDEALRYIIKSKSGLRLFQSDGLWWLVRSEMGVGEFEYREFTNEGVYVTESTFDPVLNRVTPESEDDGLIWRDQSQNKIYDQNYGFFSLEHKLFFDDNLIDEGAFEVEDIIELGDGNRTFKNWNTQSNQAGLRYGLEFVENKDSEGAFFADFTFVSASQVDNRLYSVEIPISSNTYGSANKIKLSFDYSVSPIYNVPWIRIAWSLKIVYNSGASTAYLQPNKTYSSTIDKNDVYVSSFNRFQTLEITAPMPNVADLEGTATISFYFHNHLGRDYSSLAALDAANVGSTADGKRVVVGDGGDTYFYELEFSNDAESSPDVIRPPDYGSAGKVWRLRGKYQIGVNAALVDKILLDNVRFSYIPFNPLTSLNYSPPKEAYYEQETSRFVKNNYEDDFWFGDLPDMPNAKNLYRGHMQLSDGTPTATWKRKGINEEAKLLNLALNDRIAQLSEPIDRIEDTVLQRGVFCSFVNSVDYDTDRYILTRYSLNDKANALSIDMEKTTVGADGEPPANLGAYLATAYSDAYKIS